jgi:hypothetical protein
MSQYSFRRASLGPRASHSPRLFNHETGECRLEIEFEIMWRQDSHCCLSLSSAAEAKQGCKLQLLKNDIDIVETKFR